MIRASIPGLTDVYSTETISGITGATVGVDGALWFSEADFGSYGARIHRMTTDGDVRDIKLPDQDGPSNGIARAPDGSLWITQAMDREISPGAGPDRLLRLSASGVFRTFAIPTAEGQPEGVAVDGHGDVWFTEESAGRIGCLFVNHHFKEYVLPGNSEPAAIAAGLQGDVWFVKSSDNQIGLLEASGRIKYFSPFGRDSKSTVSISTDDKGNLWAVSDMASSLVEIYNRNKVRRIPINDRASGITRGPQGSMWFVTAASVGRVNQDGKVVRFSLPVRADSTIVVGPDGNLWLAVEPIAEGAGQWIDIAKFSLR